MSAFYPPPDGVQNKSLSDAADLSQLPLEPAKAVFAAGPPRPATYEPSYSNSNSNAGDSVTSQDSLWQAGREVGPGRPYPVAEHAAGYDLGYGDYGGYPAAAYRPTELSAGLEPYPGGAQRQTSGECCPAVPRSPPPRFPASRPAQTGLCTTDTQHEHTTELCRNTLL